jgi:hypothetical protein
VRCNDTTVATTNGTDEIIGYIAWNERAVFDWLAAAPEMCWTISQGDGLVIRADTTPADDLTINLLFAYEEFG